MGDLLGRMWPIDWSYYFEGVHGPLMETLHIATLGTILSVGLAVPVGLLAANNLTPNRLVNQLARLILVSSRSVNSLVWALRSEEHTSELQSLMRISYAVFCL